MVIDIIIATYRRCDLLAETLTSVQQQTYPNWRCWIAEDGEEPVTREHLAPFLADSRFRYVPGPHVGSPARPRNRAIEAGDGELVAILDDDDLWLADKLEKQVAFLAAHPECALLGTNGYRWDGSNAPLECLPIYHRKIPAGRIDVRQMVEGNCFIASSVLVRRSALATSGLFNENLSPPLGEDYELWLRLAAVGELWFLDNPLILFREHPPNYYTILNHQELTRWKSGILQAALHGFGVPSPYTRPENRNLAKIIEEKAAALKKEPTAWRRTASKLSGIWKAFFSYSCREPKN